MIHLKKYELFRNDEIYCSNDNLEIEQMEFENFQAVYDYIDDIQTQSYSSSKWVKTGDIVKIYSQRNNKHFNIKIKEYDDLHNININDDFE